MLCHKCDIEVEESGFCPVCDSGMLNEPDDFQPGGAEQSQE